MNTAIVLSTTAKGALSSVGADTRVMATMLILRVLSQQQQRKATKAEGSPSSTKKKKKKKKKPLTMHVVAENEQDQTSQIALGPRTGDHSFESDFVNTQAIIARSLCMNLAYPQIWDSLKELFSSEPGGPLVEFLEPAQLGIIGIKVTFGALQHLVHAQYKGRAIALGFAMGSKVELCPPPGHAVKWTTNHRIVAVTRDPDLTPGGGGLDL